MSTTAQAPWDISLTENFISDLVGARERDRLTFIGEAPEGTRLPQWKYEPRLRSLTQDDLFIGEQLDQLNRRRNVRFLPGIRKRFTEVRGSVDVKRRADRHAETISFSSLTPNEKLTVLEAFNDGRHASFKCVFVSTENLSAIDAAPIPPTRIIKAGATFYVLWMLTKTIEGDQHQQIQTALAAHFGNSISDIYYLPVPGSDYIMPDGSREAVTIELWDDELVYTADELRAAFRIDIATLDDDSIQAAFVIDLSPHGDDDKATNHTPRFLSKGFELDGEQGVFYRDPDGGPLKWVMSTPLWLSDIVQTTDTREAHLKLEWFSFGNKIESVTMPASLLADRKAMSAFLYQRNILGFSTGQSERVQEYLRRSVVEYNAKHETASAHSRMGWNEKGFVIGSDVITVDGIKPANVIRVPSELKEGLTTKGDYKTWARVTQGLVEDEYWPHRFTLQAMLGTPLLKGLCDESVVLSLAGESGTAKTTIAQFGLSAFGKPSALETAPQSTEKSFYEKWRILSNLPLLCNEAATIDVKKLQNLIYAAANGEPRDTLTQKVELRATNHWSLLTVFTANNHLQDLDESVLNEATRQRLLELTTETALEGELAREINEVMRLNYGHAGRIFLKYVVENKAEVAERLKSAFEWTLEKGVRSESRYCAWIIAVAKVAGEIGAEIGLLYFEAEDACLRAIEATLNQSKEIKTPHERVADALTEFINIHHANFTHYQSDGAREWTTNDFRGEAMGRYTIKKGQTIISISRKALTSWMREKGIDSRYITRHVRENGISEKSVKLIPHGKSTRCLVLTIPESQASHLQLVTDNTDDSFTASESVN